MLIVDPFLRVPRLSPFLSLLLLFTLSVPTPSRGQNSTEWSLVRRKRQYIDGPDPFHSLGGVNEDGQARAPLVLEVTHNLTLANGPRGRCGICARTYRVLKDLQYKPSVECQRYSNSRQGALGDLTEFYHTLYNSRQQRETLTFMLSDSFPEFAFSASFIASNPAAPPYLMIDVDKSAEQALCVQSHRCPEPTTTTTTTTTTTPLPNLQPIESLFPAASHKTNDKLTSVDSTFQRPPNFWDAIMANSSPRIWVIATLVLACISLILLITLICTCIWVCQTKRSYRRKRCRGTCRFGCKCTPDTIRQAAADAAVCGPIGAQTNGSVLTYPTVGRPWAFSNSDKARLNQLYVSLAANEKMLGTQSSGTPPSQQLFPPEQPFLGDNWPQHQMSFQKSMVTKDAMWHSHSDGSSLSDHTVPSGVGSGPLALRNQPSRSSGQPATAYAFNANPSSATASTCMQSYVGAVSGQGDSGPTDGHPGSPMRFEDGQSSDQNGFNHNSTTTRPVELHNINGDLYDQGMGDMGDAFAQHSELTSITPPVGFYDINGKPTTTSKLDQSWTYGSHLQQSFVPSTNPNNLSGAVKVLPTDVLLASKQVTSNSPADYKRRNGFLNGGETPAEDTSVRRPNVGLTSHILSHPLTEGVEQNYSYKGNNDTPLRAWTDAMAH